MNFDPTTPYNHLTHFSLSLDLESRAVLCKYPVYSKELVELIFLQLYSTVSSIADAGLAKRQTAAQYLKKLAIIGILKSEKIGKERIYLNLAPIKLLPEE